MNDKKCLRLTKDALICTKIAKNELQFKYHFNIFDFFSAMLNFQTPLHQSLVSYYPSEIFPIC